MALRNDGLYLIHTLKIWGGNSPYQPVTDEQGWPDRRARRPGARKWTLVRHRPKRSTWAASTHTSARVQHLIKEQIVGRHLSGYVVKVTVWRCGSYAHSDITTESAQMPKRKCWTCTKFEGKT
jgi:hypothetical protein